MKKHAKTKDTPAPEPAAPKPTAVTVGAAKGRPMLQWIGKKPLRQVTAFPAQLIEVFNPAAETRGTRPESRDGGNLLFHGDNKDVLAWLLANGYRGAVDLVYIDPPFDSGADYVRKVTLRGKSGLATKLEGHAYSLGEQVQYTDIWANDNYLQFMYERLILLKELLAASGSLFLHCDQKRQHMLRMVLDEVFGAENFRNEIIRIKCNPKNFERAAYGNVHDLVLFYVKGGEPTWIDQEETLDSEDIDRLFQKSDEQGRKYTTVALHAAGTRNGPTGKPWRKLNPPPGRHWAYVPEALDEFDAKGLIEWSSAGNPRLKIFADEKGSRRVQDVWTMKDPIYQQYPTEKNEEVVDRIVKTVTRPGQLVLDCFSGSGTTAAVAQKLGRRWIACDINKGAIQTTSKRLQGIIGEQGSAFRVQEAEKSLPGMEKPDEQPKPAALSFGVWRVNDYDLQIQHNEAVALACEHIGVQRTKTDVYFDGTLGKKLVKIVPFNHPLSPADLEQLKAELKSRRDEERDVVIVCLGRELACEAWLEEWNRLRKKGSVPNKIEVIELRTDAKYGKFIAHQPASARVDIRRKGDEILVEIRDFVSPTILERLESQSGLLAPKIEDWRAMVDCVLIDTAYDGQTFRVALSDVPEKKSDFVEGRYTLPAPAASTTVAVKLIDMLGEEVVEIHEL